MKLINDGGGILFLATPTGGIFLTEEVILAGLLVSSNPPTPQENTLQIGKSGITIWKATWNNSSDMTDTKILDLSTLSDDHTITLTILRIIAHTSANIKFTLEIDSGTDEFILKRCGKIDVDFESVGGLNKQVAGGTGDILITTQNAADGEGIFLTIFWKAD